MGRKTFAMGDPDEYVGNYDGIESAVAQAKAVAGDKAVHDARPARRQEGPGTMNR